MALVGLNPVSTQVNQIVQGICRSGRFQNLTHLMRTTEISIPLVPLALATSAVAVSVFLILSYFFKPGKIDKSKLNADDKKLEVLINPSDPFRNIYIPSKTLFDIEVSSHTTSELLVEVEKLKKIESASERIEQVNQKVSALIEKRELHQAYYLLSKVTEDLFDQLIRLYNKDEEMQLVEQIAKLSAFFDWDFLIEEQIKNSSYRQNIIPLLKLVRNPPSLLPSVLSKKLSLTKLEDYALDRFANGVRVFEGFLATELSEETVNQFSQLPQEDKFEVIRFGLTDCSPPIGHILEILEKCEIDRKEELYILILPKVDTEKAMDILKKHVSPWVIRENVFIVKKFILKNNWNDVKDLSNLEQIQEIPKEDITAGKVLFHAENNQFYHGIDSINHLASTKNPILYEAAQVAVRKSFGIANAENLKKIETSITNDYFIGSAAWYLLLIDRYDEAFKLIDKMQNSPWKKRLIDYIFMNSQDLTGHREFLIKHIAQIKEEEQLIRFFAQNASKELLEEAYPILKDSKYVVFLEHAFLRLATSEGDKKSFIAHMSKFLLHDSHPKELRQHSKDNELLGEVFANTSLGEKAQRLATLWQGFDVGPKLNDETEKALKGYYTEEVNG